MRLVLLLGVFLLLGLRPAPPHQDMLIIPGVSVGEFLLERNNYPQVRRVLGKGERSSVQFMAPQCGRVYRSVIVSYPSLGLAFDYRGAKLSRKSWLNGITMSRPSDATTAEGISLRSHRADVLKAFGPGDTTGGGLYYGERGIEFTFDTVPSHGDELRTIHLFPSRPRTTQVDTSRNVVPAGRPPWFKPDN